MRPDDGLRDGDACRHRWVHIERDRGFLLWLCFVCELDWTSVGERPAEVSPLFVSIRGRWLP